MIVGHRLTTAPFVSTPNMGGLLVPELLVLHYTVSWPAKAVIRGFAAPGGKASAHLVLDLDGMFTQMVQFDRRAWHAGVSEWKGKPGCNGFALGIEIVNPGPVFRRGESWKDINERAWSLPIEAHEPPKGFPSTWTRWASYPEAQLSALETVCRELCREYAIRDVVGHSDVSPGRKFDPGPAFPMDRIRRACGLLDTDPHELSPDSEPTRPDILAPKLDPKSLPVIRVGSTGEHVKLCQERLRYHARPAVVDGVYGWKTHAMVADFQTARGVDADGIVGATTWALLLEGEG